MLDLSSYYKYEQVICMSKILEYCSWHAILTPFAAINEHGDLRIYRSSNRLIALEEIKRVSMIYIVLDPGTKYCTTWLDQCRYDNKQTIWYSRKESIPKVFPDTNTKRGSANKVWRVFWGIHHWLHGRLAAESDTRQQNRVWRKPNSILSALGMDRRGSQAGFTHLVSGIRMDHRARSRAPPDILAAHRKIGELPAKPTRYQQTVWKRKEISLLLHQWDIFQTNVLSDAKCQRA